MQQVRTTDNTTMETIKKINQYRMTYESGLVLMQ